MIERIGFDSGPQRAQAREAAEVLRLAVVQTLRAIGTSRGWLGVALEEGVVHPGDPPRKVDYEAREVFERCIMQGHPGSSQLSIVGVFGEEKLPPDDVVHLRPGERAVLLDPLDGSTQWAMIRAGYCVAAMMLVADPSGRVHLESAILATPVHIFTLLAGEEVAMGATFWPSRQDIAITQCLPESSVQEPSLALTGYKIKDRGSILALVQELPEWAFLTIGGNPVTPYVFAGDLTAAITLRPQSSWDAIGILMATTTDAVVGSLDGTVQDGPAFSDSFDAFALSRNVKTVEPMIVAKNMARFDEVVQAVERARAAFGPTFGQGFDEFA